MPRLLLLRHAKAERPLGITDHDRPLASRGLRDATVAGALLDAHLTGGRPTVLVSSALRARQTWEAAAPALGARRPAVSVDPRLYGATDGAHAIQSVLREVEGAMDDVIVIAHDPGLSELASACASAPVILRTCGLAVVDSDQPWSDFRAAHARVVHLDVARADSASGQG